MVKACTARWPLNPGTQSSGISNNFRREGPKAASGINGKQGDYRILATYRERVTRMPKLSTKRIITEVMSRRCLTPGASHCAMRDRARRLDP